MECHSATLRTAREIRSQRKSFFINSLPAGLRLGTSAAFNTGAPRCGNHTSERAMKKDRKETTQSEPLGIIISRGDKTEPTPVFSAYIWGPVPESPEESANRAA